jgi:SAM-dependent methyltransferase
MRLEEINELTRKAYDKTAGKYHAHFKDEVEQKPYDRALLDQFSGMLAPGSIVCDAGCGPSAHMGKYLSGKGHRMVGIDLSPRCVEIARSYNPQMDIREMDMMRTAFQNESIDAIIAFYSILYTPRAEVHKIFTEFNRILRNDGKLLVVVKKGTAEGIIHDDWYEGHPVHFTHFTEEDIQAYFTGNNFRIDFLETRKPYPFEFNVDRLYAIGTKSGDPLS